MLFCAIFSGTEKLTPCVVVPQCAYTMFSKEKPTRDAALINKIRLSLSIAEEGVDGHGKIL